MRSVTMSTPSCCASCGICAAPSFNICRVWAFEVGHSSGGCSAMTANVGMKYLLLGGLRISFTLPCCLQLLSPGTVCACLHVDAAAGHAGGECERGASPTLPRRPGAAPGRTIQAFLRLVCHPRVRPEGPSLEDLRCAVAALEAHLVRARRTAGAVVEVDEEVRVDLHPAVGVAVHLEQPGAQLGVELVVPRRVERVGDVEPAAVE